MKTNFFTTLLVSALATVALSPPASGLEERPRAVLYIAAEPGCYSATYISARTIPAKAPKKLYPVRVNPLSVRAVGVSAVCEDIVPEASTAFA